MHKRAVSMEEIGAALKSPDIQYPSFPGRLVARKRVGGRKITVVYVKEGGDNIVVTVYVEEEKS